MSVVREIVLAKDDSDVKLDDIALPSANGVSALALEDETLDEADAVEADDENAEVDSVLLNSAYFDRKLVSAFASACVFPGIWRDQPSAKMSPEGSGSPIGNGVKCCRRAM